MSPETPTTDDVARWIDWMPETVRDARTRKSRERDRHEKHVAREKRGRREQVAA